MKFTLEGLRRTTNRKTFIPEIDGLRFISIITVVLYHVNSAFARTLGFNASWGYHEMGSITESGNIGFWWYRLDLGVKIFFSISGFVLSIPFLRAFMDKGPKVNLRDYFIRRLTRLEPPFIITMMAFLLVHVMLFDRPISEMIAHFLAGLVYCHKFIFGTSNPINPVTWSLETEAQFYVLVPFLFIFLSAIKSTYVRWIFVLCLAMASVYFRMKMKYHGHLNATILAFFVNFSTGIFFGSVYVTFKSFLKERSLLWDLVGFISLVLMFVVYKPQHFVVNNIVFNLCVFTLMISVFKGTISNRFFTLPFVYVIGGMCYTIYLIHYAFLFFILRYTSPITAEIPYVPALFLQCLIVLPLLFLTSAVFFLFVEKPCMDKDWPRKLVGYVTRKLQFKAG